MLEYRLTELYRTPVNIYCNDLDALPVNICRIGRCFVSRSIGLIVVPIRTLLPDALSDYRCRTDTGYRMIRTFDGAGRYIL